MTGERQLGSRREDAHPRRVRRLFGRQHEYRLRQVELAGDRLHGGAVEALRIEYHGERIAGERPLGKDVEDMVAALHGLLPELRLGLSSAPGPLICWRRSTASWRGAARRPPRSDANR